MSKAELRERFCKRGDAGQWLCECGVDLAPDDMFDCPRCKREAAARDAQSERDRRERDRVARIECQARRPLASVPIFPHARLDSPEFVGTCRSKKLRQFAAHYAPNEGSAALLGPSGMGKTTACVALVHRLIVEGIAAGVAAPDRRAELVMRGDGRAFVVNPPTPPALALAGGIAWTSARSIVVARRQSPLGNEPALLTSCAGATLLFIDELGSEPDDRDGDLFAVVDARYSNGLPTIVTSGLASAAFDARYGVALLRRIAERGVKVEEVA